MSIKEQLRAKIDSADKLGTIFGCPDPTVESQWVHSAGLSGPQHTMFAHCPWWLRREILRVKHGVYQTSQALDAVNRTWASQHVVHVSADDPTMVAYTHSADDGLRDKQTRTTLGKFLRRTFVLMSDKQIQTLEASHRAEMTGTFQLATTAASIRHVYTTLDGDSGCMRFPPATFSIGNDRHPSEVYEAPGMGVAYTADADGVVKSRSVVWVNPDDADDKRYVRVYGDPVLSSILERSGYRMANLVGAKLAKIPYVSPHSPDPVEGTYVVPYLDGPGGAQYDTSGAYVALDGDWLMVTPAEERLAIECALGLGYVASARSTGARVALRPIPNSEFVSDMTGVRHTGYGSRAVKYWDAGVIRECTAKEAADSGLDRLLRTYHEGVPVQVLVPAGVVSFYDSGYWIDTPTNRVRCGYSQLSELFYPPSADRWTCGSTVQVDHEGVLHTVLIIDAVPLLGETGSITYVHVGSVAQARKAGYINASPSDGRPVLIHKKRPTLRRTTGGTVFDSVFHSEKFVELIDGAWSTYHSAASLKVFGTKVWAAPGYQITEADRVKVFLGLSATQNAIEMVAAITPESSVGTIEAAITVVKGTARAATVAHPSHWRVLTDSSGYLTLEGSSQSYVTWDSQVALAAYVRQYDKPGADGSNALDARRLWNANVLREVVAGIETVKPWVAENVATLKALITQKAMEAAGQLRLIEDLQQATSDEHFVLAA